MGIEAVARDIFDAIQELRAGRRPFAVATVVETRGSVSAKMSSKAVIDEHGRVVAGWVGGGCAESATCHAAIACMGNGQSAMLEVDMDDEVLGTGMPCGGHMRVYVEPVLPQPTVWIMGHGRVAECLCGMADMLGFDVVVNDTLADQARYPAASRLVTDDHDYATLEPGRDDFVVIATQHKGDHLSIKRALASSVGYVALIASRKRSRLVLDYLRREGFGEVDLGRVMAPSGLDLGARSPEEIALCVISEIVLVRRGGTGLRMRDKRVDDAGAPRLKAADR
jgi:xanthine dehydrogenase accessory factor